MNTERRKEIDKARGMIEEAKSILDQCENDEREYFDNMPENMQSGDKGQRAESAAEALNEAVGELENALGNLDTAVE